MIDFINAIVNGVSGFKKINDENGILYVKMDDLSLLLNDLIEMHKKNIEELNAEIKRLKESQGIQALITREKALKGAKTTILSDKEKQEVREKHLHLGWSKSRLAKQYNVSRQTISRYLQEQPSDLKNYT